jgi:hypothetical protein
MGVVKMNQNRRCSVTKNYKKAYVITEHKIPPNMNTPV